MWHSQLPGAWRECPASLADPAACCACARKGGKTVCTQGMCGWGKKTLEGAHPPPSLPRACASARRAA